MRRNKLALFVHFVWATWDWQPWITEGISRRVLREIESEVRKLGGTVLAINGMADHVHVLVQITATVQIADIVKQMKGASSYFINDVLKPTEHFKWQGSYGAFTVSRWDVDSIVEYINNQQQHHSAQTLLPDYEDTYELVDA